MIPGLSNIGGAQTLPQPLEQHFSKPGHAESSSQAWIQIPNESVSGTRQNPGLLLGVTVTGAIQTLPQPLEQHF